MTATVVADKVTKGAVRFTEPSGEDYPLSIYLRKEMVETLGLTAEEGVSLTLTLEAA
jgi:hypothetical protein